MNIRENVPLKHLTTMRLGGDARYVIEIEHPSDVAKAFNFAKAKDLPTYILGGGANTIARDEGFNGVVLLNKLNGIEILEEDDHEATIRSRSGVKWDDFVAFTTNLGLTGIEALSAIPGTVGAAPVQNIGAYGQDISQTILSAKVYDKVDQSTYVIEHTAMDFAYRSSIFNKGPLKNNYFIIHVTFRLKKGKMKRPFYDSLERYIESHNLNDFSPKGVREMVSAVRAEKLPDPKHIPSAGSFFKNVYLDPIAALAAEKAGVPIRKSGSEYKVNTGWLIDQAGLKGKLLHGFRVNEKASLVLINESASSYADLAAARKEIKDAVREKFGYEIWQEPVEMGYGKVLHRD